MASDSRNDYSGRRLKAAESVFGPPCGRAAPICCGRNGDHEIGIRPIMSPLHQGQGDLRGGLDQMRRQVAVPDEEERSSTGKGTLLKIP